MSRAFRHGTVAAGLVGLTGILTGCTTTLTADATLSDALSSLAQAVAADPTLNQLTVSDLVQGFEAYTNQVVTSGAASGLADANTAMPPEPSPLTADQQAQLEDLQGQLDRGEITQEQFAQQVQALIGDAAPGYAFAGTDMLGGAFPGDPVMGLADVLQLTDTQRQQAADIFTRLHTDIDTLRQNAQDQIKTVLTADQLAKLDELQAQPPPGPPPGGPGGRHMGPPPGDQGAVAPPPDQDPNAVPDPAVDTWTRLADELQLTDDQQAAIEKIRTDLQDAVQARHQQARDEFRAILTADQLTLLDQAEAKFEPQ